jgi:hypothetical protein
LITPLKVGLSEWNIMLWTESIDQSTIGILTQPVGVSPRQIDARILWKDKLWNTVYAFQLKDNVGNILLWEQIGSTEISASSGVLLCTQVLYQSAGISSFLRQSCKQTLPLRTSPDQHIKGWVILKARGSWELTISINSSLEAKLMIGQR